jgi:hypothetical protein
LIDSIEVKNSCSEDWDKMKGNDKVRFCGHCNFNVNNISLLTRKQAMKLMREADGRICVRYVKNPVDNTPVFADKLYKITRRTGIAAGVLGASLSLSTLTYAQGNPVIIKREKTEISQNENSEKDKTETATGSISGTVTDQNGAVIPNVIVKISGKNFSSVKISDGEGKFTFENLLPDRYKIEVSASYFKTKTIEVNVMAERETNVSSMLEVEVQQSKNISLEVNTDTFVTMGLMVSVQYANELFEAVSSNELEKVKNLIAGGANVNAKDENYSHITPLFVAVENGNVEIAETLLIFGAKVNAKDYNKQTPLMRLDEDTTPELVSLLLNYGAKANLVDKEGNNALILASSVVKTEVLQILINHTSNINLQYKEGRTALMEAAEADNLENVRALLLAGADVNLKDTDGDTAWDLTTDDEIESLLKSYGAVVSEQ